MDATLKQGYKYCDDVISGKILASVAVRQACERFKNDLERAKDPKCKFIFKEDWVVNFVLFCSDYVKHVRGDYANKPLVLSPWQVFIALNIFGFVKRENNEERRFKNVILFVARKNGKSFLASVMPVYLMLTGGEGLEMYSVATKKEQAEIVWAVAARIVDKLPPDLSDLFSKSKGELRYDCKFNVYKTLSREACGLDGLNPSLTVFDEAAAIITRDLVEVLTSATGSNSNYLNLFITTASYYKDTAFYEKYAYLKKILGGETSGTDGDDLFGLLYELDPTDDITKSKNWIKANPNLGVSIIRESLELKYAEVRNIPSKLPEFKVKNLNIWENPDNVWLQKSQYEHCSVDDIDRTLPVFTGIDLGSTSDLTSVVFIYRGIDSFQVESFCFLPKIALKRVPRHLGTVYANAIEAGNLTLTDGAATSLKDVADFMKDYLKDKDVKTIAYDRHNSRDLVNYHLKDESFEMVAVSQTMSNLAPAAKTMERSILSGTLTYVKNPFFEWQMSNVIAHIDVNNNIKLRKGLSNENKVDSVVALNIGMVYATVYEEVSPFFYDLD